MIRIATYNVAWFTALFSKDNRLLADNEWSARYNVTRRMQAQGLARVFHAIDADAVLVVEAPDLNGTRSTEAALLAFAAAADLRLNAVATGFESGTQQEIALFYDSRKFEAHHDPHESDAVARFDGRYRFDVDIDGIGDSHVFSKPPLELALKIRRTGRRLRMIGVHVKSKAPHGARTEDEAIRIAIENRRKQLAQCHWLRARVEEELAAGESLVVLGDFNDGPGLDEYEKLFGKSGIEVVMGDPGIAATHLHDPHAMARLDPRGAWSPATARFYDKLRRRYANALLDFILLSPDLVTRNPTWRIWHPFDDPDCYDDESLRNALLDASDHFPVTLDIDL